VTMLQHVRDANVRFGSKADMCSAIADVRFTSNSRHFLAGVSAEPPALIGFGCQREILAFSILRKQGHSTANF